MRPFPQLRKDSIVDRWVLIAPERDDRPTELEQPGQLTHQTVCPFCEGHEGETPSELLAIRDPASPADGPGWRVRIVSNRFPAVRRDAGVQPAGDELFVAEPGYGTHDVVIECPQHEASMAALSVEHVCEVFSSYRDRMIELRADPRLEYVQVFKNHGADAGASLEHAHSQILSTSRVPYDVQAELDGAAWFQKEHDRCVYCDLIERELAIGERVVAAGEHVVALAAWAGRFPFETWIMPRRHAAHFDRLNDAELADLAHVMRSVLRRLAETAGDPAYNYVLHTAPVRSPELQYYHWHWEILPRITGIAGYELATGSYLNPLPPEEAAARLRG